ncbi:MAG: hypothetical protein OXH07_08185 [Chloroflexi bacterium]|nr:hypothetical protein [Chloroflexota bacterium]
MRLLRHPRTPLELLIQGTAILMGTGVLIAAIFAIYVLASAFAVAGFVLVLIFVWELTVERPKRKARLAAAFATTSRPIEEIPLHTRVAPAHWSDMLPGPLGAVVRTAPATLAAFLIVAVALGINALLLDPFASDPDTSVYLPLGDGISGDIKDEGDRTRSVRVTILRVVDGTEARALVPSPAPQKWYWAAQVMVENTGAERMGAPVWKLQDAWGNEYEPRAASPGLFLGDGFILPGSEARTGWIVFEIDVYAEPEWLRARTSGYPALYFASQALYEEKTSP